MTDLETTINHPWPASLIELLERQHGLVTKLMELAGYQGQLIADGKTDPLLGLLSKRQKLIDEFTSMQGDLSEMTDGLEDRLSTLPLPTRDRIRSLIDEIGEGLNQVMATDQEDQKSLKSARDGISQELAETGATQQARTAYAQAAPTGCRFADRQG